MIIFMYKDSPYVMLPSEGDHIDDECVFTDLLEETSDVFEVVHAHGCDLICPFIPSLR